MCISLRYCYESSGSHRACLLGASKYSVPLMTTRWAGVLTPHARVLVATRICTCVSTGLGLSIVTPSPPGLEGLLWSEEVVHDSPAARSSRTVSPLYNTLPWPFHIQGRKGQFRSKQHDLCRIRGSTEALA